MGRASDGTILVEARELHTNGACRWEEEQALSTPAEGRSAWPELCTVGRAA